MSDERDEELLELLLDGARAGRRERVERDPELGPRLRELESFLTRSRELLRSAAPAPARAAERLVAARVLARSTRLDPGWRGDLALVLRFVGDRLGASPLLRVAAAVLLLQVLALPVLAWMVWLAPDPGRTLVFRTSSPEELEPFLPAVPEEPVDELVLDESEPEVRLVEGARARALAQRPSAVRASSTRLAAARALRRASWPRVDAHAAHPVARLLAARERAVVDGLPALDGSLPRAESQSGIARTLEVELLLDVFALSGQEPAQLRPALGRLGMPGEELSAVRELEALALERARSYGVVEPTAWLRLEASLRPGERSSDPIDPRWRRALGAALEGAPLADDEGLRSWLQGGGAR